MSKSLRVGHYQCECAPGGYEANIRKVLEGLRFAKRERLDIMTFPESFLTGYFDSKEKFDRHSWRLKGPEVKDFLKRTARFPTMFMVGFNERRGRKIYNTVLLAEKGRLIGTYCKAFPCSRHETPGRKFPVFKKNGITFGIVICADGGYIEPTRILALKGARIVFAPHYNYIQPSGLIGHFMKVRADHAARAVENGVWFIRCNNVCLGRDEGLDKTGVGYGDSYVMDPRGEMIVRSERHKECFMTATIKIADGDDHLYRTRRSAKELLPILSRTLKNAEPPG